MGVWAQTFRWSKQGSSNNIQFRKTATDRWANVYVTGYFSGSAVFGTTTLVSNGVNDIFLAKYDSSGAFLWAVKAGSAGSDYGYAVACDSTGSAYLVGSIGGNATFGNLSSFAAGPSDAFLAKYSSRGICVWVNRMGSTQEEEAYGVDCNSQGEVYVTGFFSGNCGFYSQPNSVIMLNYSQFREVFIVKYNTNGVCQWARQASSGGYASGYDITADEYGNCYLTGYYQSVIRFKAVRMNQTDLVLTAPGASYYSSFVAKYSSNGNAVWAIHAPLASYYGYAYGLGGDGYGNLYLTGYFSGQAIFGNDTLKTNASTVNWSGFVARLNTNGKYEWARKIGENDLFCYAFDAAADASSNCYLTGYSWEWGAAASNGTICGFNPTFSNTSYNLYAFGVKYKPDGNCDWLVRGQGDYNGWYSYSYGYGISVNDFGGVYLSGYYSKGISFLMNADTTKYGPLVSPSGWWGGYLALFWDRHFIIAKDPVTTAYCPGDSIKIPFYAHGVYDSSNVFALTLSDSLGGFIDAIEIGYKHYKGGWDTIAGKIPDTMPNGSGYQIRVVSSSPLVRSNKNFSSLEIRIPGAEAGNDTILCRGDSVQIEGKGIGAVAYLWHTDVPISDSTIANPFISPDSSCDIILQTFNIHGCINYDTLHVVVVPNVIPDAGPATDTICLGDTTFLKASGGNSYRWEPPTLVGDSASASTYAVPTINTTFYALVSNGVCTRTDSIKVIIRTPLDASVKGDTLVCLGQPLTWIASGKGGKKQTYQFEWYDASGNYLHNGQSYTWTPTGFQKYYVVLDDACSPIKDTAFFEVNVRNPLDVIAEKDTEVCYGNPAWLKASAFGGRSNSYKFYFYERKFWNLIDSNTSGILSVKPLVSTAYAVILQDGCTILSDTDYQNVRVKDTLELSVSGSQTICLNDSISIVAKGKGGAPSNYIFDLYTGTSLVSSNTTGIFKVSPMLNTQYWVKLRDNCSMDEDTGSVSIYISRKPNLIMMQDTLVCVGQPVRLWAQASTGNSIKHEYYWPDLGSNLQYPTVIPDSNTTYSVVLKDLCSGDTVMGSVTINLRPLLDISERPDTILCQGQKVILYASATGGLGHSYVYQWHDSSNGQFVGTGNVQVNPMVSTTYRVIVGDGCTVPEDTQYVFVKVRDPLKITFTKDTTICYGNSVQLFADASGGDSLAYTFEWSHGLTNGKSFLVTPLTTTTYKVKIIDNCTFKSDSAQMTIRVLPPLQVELDEDTTLCYLQTITIKARPRGGNGKYIYTWLDPQSNALLPDTAAQFTFTAIKDTAFRVVLSDGCTLFPDTEDIYVRVRTPLQLNITKAIKICEGQSFKFKANYSGGNAAGYKITWTSSDNTSWTSNADEVTILGNRSQWIYCLFEDGCSPMAIDSQYLEVEPLPVLNYAIDNHSGCEPYTVTFNNRSIYLPGSKLIWTFGDGEFSSDSSPVHTYKKRGTYKVRLKIISPYGCMQEAPDTMTITVFPTPWSEFRANPQTVWVNNPTVSFVNYSIGATKYSWDFGGAAGTSDQRDVIKTFPDTGTYMVELNAINQYGCHNSSVKPIRVNEVYKFFIPSAFSPDGKNTSVNEKFGPSVLACKNWSVEIYNRWGQRVYQNDQSIPWNGNVDNRTEPCPGDVYYYNFVVQDIYGEWHEYRGIVTLVR